MRALPLLSKSRRKRSSILVRFLLTSGFLLSVLPLHAQRDNYPRDRDRDQDASVNAGGNWLEYDSEDRMTATRRVRFELVSDNTLRENRSVQSRIEIFCEKGKFKYSEFTPGVSLGPPNRPGLWGQPQMEVMVRVDDTHHNHGWNWNGRVLSMDKGTTRELIGAHIFRIEFLGRGGPEIAKFSPGALDLSRVSHGCDLTPKKP